MAERESEVTSGSEVGGIADQGHRSSSSKHTPKVELRESFLTTYWSEST